MMSTPKPLHDTSADRSTKTRSILLQIDDAQLGTES